MLRRSLFALAAFLFAVGASSLKAQANYTASRSGTLQVGVAYSNANSDEFKARVTGASAYSTFDFTQHLGVEADVHLLSIVTPNDFLERDYLAGVRYFYPVHRRYEPYVKALAGLGSTSVDRPNLVVPGTPGTYGVFAFGGGLDIRLSHHINIRAIDFEEQRWPGFAPNGLTPSILSFGVAYRLR